MIIYIQIASSVHQQDKVNIRKAGEPDT